MRIAKTRSVRVLFSREIYRIRGCRRFSRSRSLLGCRCFAIFRPRRTARQALYFVSRKWISRERNMILSGIRDPRYVNGRGTVVVNSRAPPIRVCVCFIYGFRLERPRVADRRTFLRGMHVCSVMRRDAACGHQEVTTPLVIEMTLGTPESRGLISPSLRHSTRGD